MSYSATATPNGATQAAPEAQLAAKSNKATWQQKRSASEPNNNHHNNHNHNNNNNISNNKKKNNNISKTGGGCREGDHKAPGDRNSSAQAETRPESDQRHLNDKRREPAQDGRESSPVRATAPAATTAAAAVGAVAAPSRVESSLVCETTGDMSAQRRAAPQAAGGAVAGAEDAARDKRAATATVTAVTAASAAGQVEQTRGAQQPQPQPQLGRAEQQQQQAQRAEEATAHGLARGHDARQAQGQGQGRCDEAEAEAQAETNVGQNTQTAATLGPGELAPHTQPPDAAAAATATATAAPLDQARPASGPSAGAHLRVTAAAAAKANSAGGHHILELNASGTNHKRPEKQQQQQAQALQLTPLPDGLGAHLIPTTGPGGHQPDTHLKHNNNNNNNISTTLEGPFATPTAATAEAQTPTGPPTSGARNTKRLSYLQALLLRRWPCLALAICIMSSLLFGILLSAATVYLMHGFTNCNAELAHLASSLANAGPGAGVGVGGHHNQHLHHLHHHHQDQDLQHEQVVNFLPAPSGLNAADAPDSELTRRLGLELAPMASALGGGGGGAGDDKQLTNKTSIPQAPAGHFQRLPSSLVPKHYNLFIWPHIAEPAFPFTGSVEIHLTCKSATRNITLHNIDLDIVQKSIRLSKLTSTGARAAAARQRRQAAAAGSSNATATAAAGQPQLGPLAPGPAVARVSQDKQLQYSIIQLDEPLEPGQDYLLRLDFSGALNEDLAGFYRMKYERPNSSEPTWIAATQFQATDARRAFPCFDEPLYKATFSIKIKHWTNMTALSNMPIVSSEKSSDGLWITDTFAKSQRMSTYLVAFAVTNFESRSAGNITVWTRPGLSHTAEYALRIAERILRHYEHFFGIAYPLPKMDMIALPDFNAGAMENWGLITYRETAMLYDPKSSSVANKQRVAVVVAHELAHQWFGNLVTPRWWDDLWLNEGFASFVEYLGVDHVEPKWRMLDQFVVEEVQNVFKLDALSSSHQISIPVNNPDEISEIFDHISYAKGASIIRMMNYFLTPAVFKRGLQRYLQALKYDNAEQSDLWAHLTAAAAAAAQEQEQQQLRARNNSARAQQQQQQQQPEPIDVYRVMNSWTLQTGYPLVTLTRDYDEARATLEQVRYQPYKILVQDQQQQQATGGNKTNASTSTAAAAAAAGQRWEIPITYTWKSEQNWEPNTRLWLHQDQAGPVAIGADSAAGAPLARAANEWVLVNVQQAGYYRVNYDVQNWRLLVNQLQEDHTKIGTTNRAQLLDDLFELAKSSLIDYKLAMESTKYLSRERDYLPWESVLLSFGYIDEMLQRTPLYGDWQDYFARVIEPYYARYKDLDWTKPQQQQQQQQPPPQQQQQQQQQVQAANASLDSNDVLEQYNQVNAVSWACQTNNQHCIAKAKSVFASWRATRVNNIMPGMRYAAYCAAIEYGTKDDWDFLWSVYQKELGATERDRILRALGCSKEMWILARYLEWTFDKSKPIRRQDGAFVFRMIAKNNYGRDLAFNFMRERWPTIREYYGKTSFGLGHLIKSVATSMNTQVELDQLKRFHESIKNDIGTGKRSFQIAIEEVESNLYWRNKNYKNLESWLSENQKKQRTSVGVGAQTEGRH